MIQNVEKVMPELYYEYRSIVTLSETVLELHPFAFITMVAAIIGDKICFID